MNPPRPLRRGPAAAPPFFHSKKGVRHRLGDGGEGAGPALSPSKKGAVPAGTAPHWMGRPYSSAFPARMFL